MTSFLSSKRQATAKPDHTGDKQTIPARHGTATFVPKSHTIKIINTYGSQVVDTWAFVLGAPPTDDDIDQDSKAETNGEQKPSNAGAQQRRKDREEKDGGGVKHRASDTADEAKATAKKAVDTAGAAAGKAKDGAGKTAEKTTEKAEDTGEQVKQGAEKVTEKVDTEAKKTGWSAYIPSVRSRGEQSTDAASKTMADTSKTATDAKEKTEDAAKNTANSTAKSPGDATKFTGWSSYIPSVRSSKPKQPRTKEQKEKEAKGWSAYLPSGQGFSAYLSTGKGPALSAFVASHQRDPTKSYAEQLYDFGKTPVGAASLSAATGSGYAGSLYAAYIAYNQTEAASAANQPPMEYMSMQHTRASISRLVPHVGDTLTTNLRAPVLTMVEDTSPGIHDTLIAACDPQRYKELGVEKWEEHGSCAENLVFALKELNAKVGLKGRKAIGSDVTVYTVPAPLNLFMNIPWTDCGSIEFAAPKSKRGDYVKFRAERDVVVVMSACPQDVLAINGKKPMVAHFVVESPSEEDRKKAEERDREAQSIIEKARQRTVGQKVTSPPPAAKATKPATPRRTTSTANAVQQLPPAEAKKEILVKRLSIQAERKPSTPAVDGSSAARNAVSPSPVRNSPQPGKKKPKKLERRSTPQNA